MAHAASIFRNFTVFKLNKMNKLVKSLRPSLSSLFYRQLATNTVISENEQKKVVKPLEHPDFFDVKKLVNINDMFK